MTTPLTTRRAPSRHHSLGFWFTALAFLANMAFSAVPTPLYALYEQRDHFSTFTVTIVFAVYAVGVVVSLFLGGHVSDWVGRKRILVPALLVNVAAAAVFILAPSLAGLIVARIVSGVSVGLTTATATAYLAELHAGISDAPRHRSPRRAQVVATAANLGGIGVGPLVAGLLAQYAPQPLVLPYVVFGIVLTVLAVLVAVSPETGTRPDPMPAWRPQRIAVPRGARATFGAAVAAGLAAFAVFGVFTSLAPTFLAVALHEGSHAVAGALVFAAFAAAAVAQILMSRAGIRVTLLTGTAALVPGLVVLTAAMWLPSLPAFVAGGILAGAGGGLVFRGALAAAGATAPPGARAEVLAGFFVGAYVGLSIPVLGLGTATQYAPAQDAMVVFAAIVAAAVVLAVRAVLATESRRRPGASDRRTGLREDLAAPAPVAKGA